MKHSTIVQKKNNRDGLLFLSPALIYFAFFVIFPFLFSLYLSFTKWKGGSILNLEFIGLSQYTRAFQDPDFWQSLINTCYYTFGITIALGILSLIVAIALNQKVIGKTFFRGVFFVPVVMSTIVCGVIWDWMYNPDQSGLINVLLSVFHINPVGWLSDPKYAMSSIIFMSIWKWVGYCMVMYLAGLQNIPSIYYEVASLDGANGWNKFTHVTVPLLSNTIWFVFIINVINSFQVFDQVFVMTRGGPIGSTSVVVYYMYQQAFQNYDLGYASAISWLLFIVIFLFTLLQMQLAKKSESNII